jgi:hypothetical protein
VATFALKISGVIVGANVIGVGILVSAQRRRLAPAEVVGSQA